MPQVKSGELRQRIERYLDDSDWDVVCRKRNGAYSLFWADDETLLARLKPTGHGDEVEIFWWNGERWRAVDEFGCVLPLDEALDFVFEDPDGLFLDGAFEAERELSVGSRWALGQAFYYTLLAAAFGSCGGGLASTAAYGWAIGAVLAYLAFAWFCGRVVPWAMAVKMALALGGPAIFAAAVGGTLGGGLNDAVVTAWWGRIAGLLIGGSCGVLIYAHPRLAWLISFSAGLLLAFSLVELLGISQLHVVSVVAAIMAAGLARLCHRVRVSPAVTVGCGELYQEFARLRKELPSGTHA